MNITTFAKPLLAALVLSSGLCSSHAATSTERPNIVIILTDDQGYADISFNPDAPEEVHTPHMDRLANESVFFSQGYTSGVVCSPTRAGLMIGQYQQRVGVYTAGEGGEGFDPSRKIFPSFLPEEYRSMAIGKWHLGLDNDYPELKWHAVNRGFDEAYKFMGRGAHDYFGLKGMKGDYSAIYKDLRRIDESEYKGYLTTRLSEEAVDFIDREKDNPFFLYLAYNAVHTPAQAPQEDIDYYKNKYPHLSERRAILMAMLKHLDDGVGMVVNKLKKEGIWDNTIVFFLSDNGGTKAMEADNGHLRDYKQTVYEGGVRTPFMMSWPNKFKGGRTIDTPIISFDLLPTVLDALGENPPEAKHFDGKSILPLITENATDHHETLYWDTSDERKGWAIRQGKWKLIGIRGKLELYDMEKDQSETTNLAKQHPETVESLKKQYQKWRSQMAEPSSAKKKKKNKNKDS
ncbi:sulfatase-like hydrolase/transferase [Pelagicoccus mobilis]|uniref:Sulfatase-like hydrolase/transferase n=1 Tax=Pelagicoccus mobilis TaxID=415221 RepID=A0A934S3A7_9BACT|nr:sulfatase-like hydrolase/transferase [Pelagicoccus mobilis]MBK1879027.1 sulfatase-like hydrolase/transferase [Pelagicoccus mobilis]